jgi:hypothetical protein
MPSTYSLFQRLSIPEIARAAGAQGLSSQLGIGPEFQGKLDKQMGYWEARIPAGKRCFVHYAIGDEETIAKAFDRLAAAADRWTVLGTYHVEPQSSAYPASFPTKPAPSHWIPGEARAFTTDSIFWFNFFPAQPHLFEKTFAIWLLFNTFKLAAGGECNQLVAWEGKERFVAHGVDEFVQVNLNRFTSLAGYFASAQESGKHTFTVDPEYHWYGMLLRKIM